LKKKEKKNVDSNCMLEKGPKLKKKKIRRKGMNAHAPGWRMRERGEGVPYLDLVFCFR